MEFKYITQTVPDWDLKMTGEIRGGGLSDGTIRAGTHGEILLGTRKHTVNFWLVNTHFCIHVSIVHRAFA